MSVILGVLCGLYGTYCVTFCCTACFTVYYEKQEEKRKKELELKRQYQQILIDEQLKLELIQTNIINQSRKNIKLETIIEVKEHFEYSSDDDEMLYDEDTRLITEKKN